MQSALDRIVSRRVRVLVSCDPPLLTEVVSLAVSRIDGVELVTPDGATPDRVLILSGANTLAELAETISAWISQAKREDYTLYALITTGDNAAAMASTAGEPKPLSDRSTAFIRSNVIQNTRGRTGGRSEA